MLGCLQNRCSHVLILIARWVKRPQRAHDFSYFPQSQAILFKIPDLKYFVLFIFVLNLDSIYCLLICIVETSQAQNSLISCLASNNPVSGLIPTPQLGHWRDVFLQALRSLAHEPSQAHQRPSLALSPLKLIMKLLGCNTANLPVTSQQMEKSEEQQKSEANT